MALGLVSPTCPWDPAAAEGEAMWPKSPGNVGNVGLASGNVGNESTVQSSDLTVWRRPALTPSLEDGGSVLWDL